MSFIKAIPTVLAKTAAYTVTTNDGDNVHVNVDATAGAATITLYPAAGNSGKIVTVKKTDASANAVTIDGNAAETLDGAATLSLSSQHDVAILVCDGSNWQRAAKATTNASDLTSGTLANARLNPIVPPTVVVLTDGATPALDAALGNVFHLTAAASRTIAIPTNPTSGQKIIIRHLASGGAWTLALNTGAGGFRFGTDVTGLTATTSGKIDYIGAVYNATDSKWDVVAYSKGY